MVSSAYFIKAGQRRQADAQLTGKGQHIHGGDDGRAAFEPLQREVVFRLLGVRLLKLTRLTAQFFNRIGPQADARVRR